MSLLQVLQHSRIPRNLVTPPVINPGDTLIPNFATTVYHNSEVNLHDLSVQVDGSLPYDTWIDWGDGSLVDKLLCPRTDATTDGPVRWISHSYKSNGFKPITLTTFDHSGGSKTTQQLLNIQLAAPASLPSGRLFGGVDQFPSVDSRLLKYGQPIEYLNTTQPTEAIVNPSLVRTVNTVTALDTAFAELGTSGGTIFWTGGNIDGWTVPDRPVDSNGVRYNTVIWIQTHASVRPVGYPAPYTRITPAIGAALPAFRSPNNSTAAINIGDSTHNGQYKYNVRFTGFGITVTPTYTNVRSGGGLVLYGNLSRGIVFEQCYSYLPSEQTAQIGIRRDFAMSGGYHAWIDGWHWGNRDDSTDSQALGGWDINGPLKVVNCFLSGSEAWIVGGASPSNPADPELSWRVRDLEVRMCHLWRDVAALPTNIRYYDGSGPLQPGKLLNSGIHVTSFDSATGTATLSSPITIPDGSFSLPNIAWRRDYVVYVRSGTGAGQGGMIASFNSTQQIILGTFNGYRSITTLDNTSVIEIRLKIRWITKNNGEFKDCRRSYVSECVFENSGIGDDSQWNVTNYKTSTGGSADRYPSTNDVSTIDCIYLNVFGGIFVAALPVFHGLPATRFHFENILIIGGSAADLAGGNNAKNRPLAFGADDIYAKGITAIGFEYGILSNQQYVGGTTNLNERQYLHGLISQAPSATTGLGYWFSQLSDLDLSSADYAGNAVFGTSSMPVGSPGTWYTEPTAVLTDVFNNPDNTDFWGAADYEIKPGLVGLIAATPNRLDWARLQSRTNGVRADVSIIPYQWD